MGKSRRLRNMIERQDSIIYLSAVIALAFLAMLGASAGHDVHAAETTAPMAEVVEPGNADYGPGQAGPSEIIIDTSMDDLENVSDDVPPENIYSQIWKSATDEERDMFVRILALEAQGEPYEGIMAAAEVMFNRVASPEWPDTILGVLSQKGQFTAWKYRNDPWNSPTMEEYHAIDDVILAGPQVLPSDYVYFATYKANGSGFIKIGHHYFSR